MPAVDCHAHVFPADAPPVAGARYRPAYAATLEDWQGHWSTAGITHGVLVQPSFLGTDNEEMMHSVERDRDRLRAVVVVDPSFDDRALRALGEHGAVGLRFNLHGMSRFDERFEGEWRALLERCRRLGWHLEVYTGPGAAPRVARALEPIAIPVVFAHFAAPDPDDPEATYAALARLARDRPVHCKLSAPYRLAGADPAACARACVEAVGRDHVVWGSDWPFTQHEEDATYGRVHGDLEEWCGGPAPDVLWDNASRLYRFA